MEEQQVVRDHDFVRHPIAGTQHAGAEIGRVPFVPAEEHAEVAVVMVTYNSASDINGVVDDLREAARDHAMRVVVVDNQSSDATVQLVRATSDVILVESGGNLGYAGGINAGLRFVGQCDAVLILNPDLRLAQHAVTRMLEVLEDDRIGVVVPLVLDEDGSTFPSLRREPSLTRAIGDACLGSKLGGRPHLLSETDFRSSSYLHAHDVEWATGAALLVAAEVVREVGDWNEEFFLYSEETDYFRRIRDRGHLIRFQPSAVVTHRRGGSGMSSALMALMAVNRVRYVERHHGRTYATLFRAAVAFAEALRSYDPVHRSTLRFVLNRARWQELPQATKSSAS